MALFFDIFEKNEKTHYFQVFQSASLKTFGDEFFAYTKKYNQFLNPKTLDDPESRDTSRNDHSYMHPTIYKEEALFWDGNTPENGVTHYLALEKLLNPFKLFLEFPLYLLYKSLDWLLLQIQPPLQMSTWTSPDPREFERIVCSFNDRATKLAKWKANQPPYNLYTRKLKNQKIQEAIDEWKGETAEHRNTSFLLISRDDEQWFFCGLDVKGEELVVFFSIGKKFIAKCFERS